MGFGRKLSVAVTAAIIVVALTAGISVALVKDPSPQSVTYYGCLHEGSLTKLGTTSPKCTTKGSTIISWNSVGPQGPAGAQGQQGNPGTQGPVGPQGPSGSPLNLKQIGTLQWYPANQSGISVATGSYTGSVVFDGEHIWALSVGKGTVTEIDPSTAAILATYNVGYSPNGLAYDGANLWVTFNYAGTVEKIQASTGTVLGTYNVGTGPAGVAFDGTNIWVVNQGSNTVTKLLASTGAVLGTYATGTRPRPS